jgi:hypothetical protein
VSGVNEASGLAATDRLEGVVEEDVLDIKLVHRAVPERARVSTVWTVD